MKKFFKKLIIWIVSLALLSIALLLLVDKVILPAYVDEEEVTVPELSGKPKEEAERILSQLQLRVVFEGPRFDETIPRNYIIAQDPLPGKNVKINRNIYLLLSGGDPLIKMPALLGKTFRDGKITLERLGLNLGQVEEVRSEFPVDRIVGQEYPDTTFLEKGDSVDIKISIGPQLGMIRVPNLLGETLSNAERVLRRYSLKLGKVNYLPSKTLLPNTIWDQYPSKDKLVNYGDSVDVFVAKSISK